MGDLIRKDNDILNQEEAEKSSFKPSNLLILQYLGYGLLCLLLLKYLLFAILLSFLTIGGLLAFIFCGVYFIKVPKSSDSSIRTKFPKLSFTKPEIWEEEIKSLRLNQASMSSNMSGSFSRSIDQISEFILRDFVISWFQGVSDDPSFPNQVRIQLKLAITELESRLYLLDASNFFVLEILPLVTDHFNNFVSAEEIVMGEQRSLTRSNEVDFKIAQEFGKLHPALSIKDLNNELEIRNYSRSRIRQVVPSLLSQTEQSSSAATILVREILTNTVFVPVIQLISDPDFWNQTIIKMASATLKDRDQVRELKSAIDKQYNNPTKPLIPTITKNALLDQRISPNMRQPEFEKYLKAIDKSESLPILKQLKYYLAMQINRIQKIQSNSEKFLKYRKRLHLARNLVEKRLELLGSPSIDDKRSSVLFTDNLDGFISNLSLSQVLSNPSSLSFFMEFMEQRARTVLLQYWLTVNGIKDPLEDPKDPDYEEELSSSVDMDGSEDIKQIFNRYFNDKTLKIEKETYAEVESFVDGSARNLSQYIQVRKLILMLQEEIFHRMEERDLPDFKNSDLFLKLLSSEAFEESLVNEVDLTHEPNYGDFENDDEDIPPNSDERPLQELETAFSDIMSREELEKPKKPVLSKSTSSESSNKLGTTDDLKNEIFGSSNKGFLTEKPLFDDSDDDEIEEDETVISDSKFDVDPEFFSVSHDVLNLKEEISKLEQDIEKLNQQNEMLDPLILKAELTNNTNELRILKKSKASYEREIEAKELQKQQLIVQDNDSSLFGKTTVSIQSWVKGRSHGKDYILYVVEVQKATEGKSGTGWIIGRRFSQFHRLNELMRKKYPEVDQLPFPRKKIILKFQQKALIDQRRHQLENYLKELLKIEGVCSDKEFRRFLTTQDYKVSALSESPTPGANRRSMIEDTANKLYNGLSSSIEKLNSRTSSNENLSRMKQVEDSVSFSQSVEKVEDMQKELDNYDSPAVGSRYELQKSFIKPVTDLVIALFSLNRSNSWLRGRAIIVVLQQIFGSTIEKHIKELIYGLTTEEKILDIVNMLRDIIWPNGKFMESGIPRSNKEKSKSKQEAKVLLETLMIDTCSKIVGQPSAKSASNKVFSMAQNEILNRSLVYQILDKVLESIFPEISNQKMY